MPKRKSKDDYEHLTRKLRKLERKIRRKTRRASSSSSDSITPQTSEKEDDVTPIDLDMSSEMPVDTEDNIHRLQSEIAIPENSGAVASAPIEPVVRPSVNFDPVIELPEPTLDNDILEILGIDPTTKTKFGKDINDDLAIRLQHYSTTGLTKEMRKELAEKYLTPGNCKFIDAPQLNPEIKAALTEQVAKRDKHIELRQQAVATALSCLSKTLTSTFVSQNKDTNLIRSLMDTSRILCDCQYNDSVTRRNFSLSSLKKDMKEQLQNTKVDSFLFGENLPETLKAAKVIYKSGAELKANPPPRTFAPKKSTPGQSKNWKASANKKPPPSATQKTKEAAAPKNRPSTSYKQSQPRHSAGSSRR